MSVQQYLQQALDLLVSVRTEESAGLANLTFSQGRALAKVEGILEFLNDSMKVSTDTEYDLVAPSNNESIIL